MTPTVEAVDVCGEALALATEGHRVFPVRAGEKVPAIKDWPNKATTDPATIREWFGPGGKFEGCNLGMRGGSTRTSAAGEIEHLAIIDLDIGAEKNGIDTLRRACEARGIDTRGIDTRTQRTPSGGAHLLFWSPHPIKQGANVIGPGVDTRSNAGYIVVAPSRTEEGAYRWVDRTAPIAPMGELASLFDTRSETPRAATKTPLQGVDADRATLRAVAYLAAAPAAVEGQGGDIATYKVAAALKDLGCTEPVALDLLAAHWSPRCAPPWSDDDLATKVAHAYRYGKDAPGIAAPEAVFPPIKDAQPAPSRTGLAVTCVADVEARPIAWLWPQVLALGKHSTIAGEPGLGKSQISIWLAAVVSTGATLPDGTACPQGSVILITAEDDVADTIRPRLEAAGADLTRVHVVDGVPANTSAGQPGIRGFDMTTDVQRLAELVDALRDLRLIVIDPMSAFLGGTDSHKAAEVRAAMGAISKLAETRRAALVSINHLNKNTGSSAMARVSGSGAFVAQPRAAYIVTRDKGDPQLRVMAPLKNNIGDDRTAFFFRVLGVTLASGIDTSRIEWQERTEELSADEALDQKAPRAIGEAVLRAQEFLRLQLQGGPRGAVDVKKAADAAGISDATLRRAKSALAVQVKKETGTRFGSFLWSLPTTAGEVFS